MPRQKTERLQLTAAHLAALEAVGGAVVQLALVPVAAEFEAAPPVLPV